MDPHLGHDPARWRPKMPPPAARPRPATPAPAAGCSTTRPSAWPCSACSAGCWPGGPASPCDSLQPDPRADAVGYMQTVRGLPAPRPTAGRCLPPTPPAGIDSLRRAYADNPYFAVETDPKLTDGQRAAAEIAVDRQQWGRRFLTDVLTFGPERAADRRLPGRMAEPLLAGNPHRRRPSTPWSGRRSAWPAAWSCRCSSRRLYAKLSGGAAAGDAVDPRRVLAARRQLGRAGPVRHDRPRAGHAERTRSSPSACSAASSAGWSAGPPSTRSSSRPTPT